jgi:hypothetical protein
VAFSLTFNAAAATTNQQSFINTVQSDVASMAGVSTQQVQVTSTSSAASSSGRRLLQQTSSQLQVTISAASSSVAQAAYSQFQTAFTSTNSATNPLLSQGVDTTSSPVAVYSVTCPDGSNKPSTADCSSTVTNAAATSSVAFSWVSLALSSFAILFAAVRA